GSENLCPLHDDPPRGESRFVKTDGGFGTAAELVSFIRAQHDFCLAGACYPQKHPEAPDLDTDLRHLKSKVDAGVDFLVTQLFFDNADYFAFVEKARQLRIERRVIAGIWPITNLAQIQRITGMCGATIPAGLLAKLEGAR